MPFDPDSARAAGLKGNASRDPETASAIAKAAAQKRWRGHVRKSAPTELPAGPVLTYWITQVAARYPDEFGTMNRKALVRRATLLARQAAAEALAARPEAPAPTNGLDPFSIIRERNRKAAQR